MADAHYQVRPLARADYDKGYLGLLGQLTTVGEISRAAFEARLDDMERDGAYRVHVIEDAGAVVATASMVVEKKFIHECGQVGHIEDVVVDQRMRGKKLGQRVVDSLIAEAKAMGCYKVILDCAESNVPFYEKCGLSRKEVQMVKYL